MLDLLDLTTAKRWLRFDDTYTEEDDIIELLCQNAEIYVKKAVGEHYKLTEENKVQAKLLAMILVTNWYENRDFTGTVEHIADKARRTVESIILQLQLSVEEATTIMNTGRMRHSIEFQRLQNVYDEEGFPKEEKEYITFQGAKAEINDLYGKEYWQSKQTISEKITIFKTRYYKNIDENCTILFRDQRYEIIEPPDNVKYLNKELIIKARLQGINSGN